MSALTSKQRAHLRSRAHSLKPILQVGADGVSEPFLTSLDEAFNTRELLKVRALDTCDLSVKEVAREISHRRAEVEVVQTIGHVAVLYRPSQEGSEIELP